MHALSFPRVERVVYSTCSIDQRENEDVVANCLRAIRSEVRNEESTPFGFESASPYPESFPSAGARTRKSSQCHDLLAAAEQSPDGEFALISLKSPLSDPEFRRAGRSGSWRRRCPSGTAADLKGPH